MGACNSCFETSKAAIPPPAPQPVEVETVADQREQNPDVVVYDETLELPVSPTTVMASQGYTFAVTQDTSEHPGQEEFSATVVESNRPSGDAVEEVVEEVSDDEDGDSVKSGDVEITSTAAEPSMVETPEQTDRVTPMSNPMPVELLRTAAALRASQSEDQQPQTSQAPAHALTPEGASFAMAACSGISLSSMNSASGKSEDESPVVPTVAQTIMTMTSGVQPGATGPAYQAADEAGSMMPIDAGALGQLPLGLAEVSAQFDIGFVQQGPDETEEIDAISTEDVTEVVDEVTEVEPMEPQSKALTDRQYPYMYDRMPGPPTTRKFPYLYDRPELTDSVEGDAACHCSSSTGSVGVSAAVDSSMTSKKFPYLYDHPEGTCSSSEASTSMTSRKFPYLYDHPEGTFSSSEASTSMTSRKFPYLYDHPEGTCSSSEASTSMTSRKFPYLYDHPEGTCSSSEASTSMTSRKFPYLYDHPEGTFSSSEASTSMTSRKFPYLYDHPEGTCSSSEASTSMTSRKFPYLYDHPVVSNVECLTEPSAPQADRKFPYLYGSYVENTTAGGQEPTRSEESNEEPTITLSTCTESKFPYLYDEHPTEDVKVLCPAAATEGFQTEAGSKDSLPNARKFPYLYDKVAENKKISEDDASDVPNSIRDELSDRKFPYLYDNTVQGAVDIPATKTQTTSEGTTRAARSLVRE